ncbi:DUF943 family protein [Pluralibacter gergoviae]
MRKSVYLVTLLVGSLLLIAYYFNALHKPEVMFTFQQKNFTNIVVRQFPLTVRGKIAWWKNNREKLKNKFNIPVIARNGDWYVDIWNFGDGFKKLPEGDVRIFNSDTQDMMCFDKDKCIDKDLLMRVENNRRGGITITIGDKKIDEN